MKDDAEDGQEEEVAEECEAGIDGVPLEASDEVERCHTDVQLRCGPPPDVTETVPCNLPSDFSPGMMPEPDANAVQMTEERMNKRIQELQLLGIRP